MIGIVNQQIGSLASKSLGPTQSVRGSEKLRTPYLYPQNYVPPTLETMHSVPLARNHVSRTLETMHFHQKFDKKVE